MLLGVVPLMEMCCPAVETAGAAGGDWGSDRPVGEAGPGKGNPGEPDRNIGTYPGHAVHCQGH